MPESKQFIQIDLFVSSNKVRSWQQSTRAIKNYSITFLSGGFGWHVDDEIGGDLLMIQEDK